MKNLEIPNASLVSQNISLKTELSSALQAPLPLEAVDKLNNAIEHIHSMLSASMTGTSKRPLERTEMGDFNKNKQVKTATAVSRSSVLEILQRMNEISFHDDAKDPKMSNPSMSEDQ